MPVLTEYQAVIQCDFCSDSLVEGMWRQKEAIAEARKMGWTIGKKVTCPNCKKARISEVRNDTIGISNTR